jgi:hypothetical protein
MLVQIWRCSICEIPNLHCLLKSEMLKLKIASSPKYAWSGNEQVEGCWQQMKMLDFLFFLSFVCGRFLFLMRPFCFGWVFGCHGWCQLQICNKKSWGNAVRPLSTSSSIVCVCVKHSCLAREQKSLLENRRVAREQQPIIAQSISTSVYERLYDKSLLLLVLFSIHVWLRVLVFMV